MSANQSLSSSQSYPSGEELRMVYQELCTGYHNIEDFRSKLLGLLPFVTASSFAATMISNPTKSQALANLVLPFGALGALVTLGLFFYEAENLKRSTRIPIKKPWIIANRGRVFRGLYIISIIRSKSHK